MSGALVVSANEIKEVVLSHCKSVLKYNEPDIEYAKEIAAKDKLHDLRMNNSAIVLGDFKIGKGLFDKVINKYKKSGKKNYDFLVKSGEEFKNSVLKFCSRIIADETFPKLFEKTTLHQKRPLFIEKTNLHQDDPSSSRRSFFIEKMLITSKSFQTRQKCVVAVHYWHGNYVPRNSNEVRYLCAFGRQTLSTCCCYDLSSLPS